MNIPDKAVEAAVNARGRRNNPKWDNEIFGYEQFSEDQRAFLRDEARAILEAAAPHLIAGWLRDKQGNYPGKDFESARAKYLLEIEAQAVESESSK